MKEGYKIVIFGNSIFDSKGPVRKVKFEIQQYKINFQQCRYCGGIEVQEKYFIPQQFLNSNKSLEIDLIQLSYPSSPRGIHSVVVEEGDYYNSGMHSNFPNTYNGWGSYPSNLYIPIKSFYLTIDEINEKNINVIAVRQEVPTEQLTYFVGQIKAGDGGNWGFYINKEFKPIKIEPELFGHPNCVKELHFSELDQQNLIKGINKGYFTEIGKKTYVSADGEEVWHNNQIYTPYKTDKGLTILLADDFTGLDENYEKIYYDRDNQDRVRVYYESNFERGINFDFAVKGKIDISKEEEFINIEE